MPGMYSSPCLKFGVSSALILIALVQVPLRVVGVEERAGRHVGVPHQQKPPGMEPPDRVHVPLVHRVGLGDHHQQVRRVEPVQVVRRVRREPQRERLVVHLVPGRPEHLSLQLALGRPGVCPLHLPPHDLANLTRRRTRHDRLRRPERVHPPQHHPRRRPVLARPVAPHHRDPPVLRHGLQHLDLLPHTGSPPVSPERTPTGVTLGLSSFPGSGLGSSSPSSSSPASFSTPPRPPQLLTALPPSRKNERDGPPSGPSLQQP